MAHPKARRRRGVTILEALVALVIVALGLLSFIALQARMRLNSDVARQRGEAVRIAQENMENFRAFGTLTADGTVGNNFSYAGVANGASAKTVLASSVSTSTNATYTVTQTVSTSGLSSGMKEVQIGVAWTDRENQAQSVTLRSFIAGVDPKLAAALAIPPNGSPIKDPLGRDLRVPIPAKDLGDGTSAFKPNNSGTLAFVFNNATGAVTGRCTSVPTGVSTQQITTSNITGYGCTSVTGLLLSGYVRFSLGNTPDATTPNDATLALSMRVDLDQTAPPSNAVGTTTQLTAAYWPTSAQATWVAGYTAPDCGTQDSKVVRYTAAVSYSQVNNGTTQTASSTFKTAVVPLAAANTAAGIAPFVSDAQGSISNVTDLAERFIAYTCVIYPRSFSGTSAWTGRSLIVPSGWTIGSTSTTYKVCRYSEDYDLDGQVWTTSGSNVTKIDNAEHPYAYLMATIGLNNQNFLVIKGNKSCPTDGAVEVDGTGGENYTNETTVSHQF